MVHAAPEQEHEAKPLAVSDIPPPYAPDGSNFSVTKPQYFFSKYIPSLPFQKKTPKVVEPQSQSAQPLIHDSGKRSPSPSGWSDSDTIGKHSPVSDRYSLWGDGV